MSPIGRIFVVINLVLAGLFLGSAATSLASAQKYKADFDGAVKARQDLKAKLDAEIGSLEAEKLAAESLRNEIKTQKDALETQKLALEQDIAAKTDEVAQMKASLSGISSGLGDMSTQLENQSSQVEQANNERMAATEARRTAEAERADAIEAKAAAEDKVNDLNAQIASLRTELNTTRNELQSTSTLLTVALDKSGETIETLGGAAPKIDGAVLQVATNVKPGLVHINRGSADAVKAGYEFDIYSSGVYKGRAKVEIVNANSCTARITAMVDGTTIMQGDTASTRI